MIDLVTRAEWGARYADGFKDRPLPFTEFWLHHSVTIAPDLVAPFDDDYKAVQTLESIGQSRFGAGISYNQPVTPAGLVFVGVSPHRVGAHTKGHNTEGFAFVLVGDYSKRPPTANQEEMIARRMVELHRQGKAIRHTLNGGHRDASGSSTACPGNAAHARIPFINARANALWAAGYAKPGGSSGSGGSTPKPPSIYIPGTRLALLKTDGSFGPASSVALGTVMKLRGHNVVPSPTVRPDLVRAIQVELRAAGKRDRDGRAIVVDGKGFGSNASGRYPSSGWTRTITALQIGHGVSRANADGYFSANKSSEVSRIQADINRGGAKDSPLFNG